MPTARSAVAVRWALAFVIIGACLAAAGAWRVYSNTWDEPEHLAAGVELLDRGIYEYDTEHPPLGRIVMALGPYLAGARSFDTPGPSGVREGVDILYSGGGEHYELYLTLARLGMLPFLALLLFVTWLWGRALFAREATALLSVVLLASVPPVLGHGALASLDVPAAATMLLAFYALQRWLLSAALSDAVFFGVTTGVAVATKFSAVPFIGLGFIVLAVLRALCGPGGERAAPWGSAGRGAVSPAAAHGPAGAAGAAGAAGPTPRAPALTWLAGFALIVLTVLLPLLLVYGPRAHDPAGAAHRIDWAIAYLLQRPGLDHQLGVVLQHLWVPRPLGDLVDGIVAVMAHNDAGHLSYLLGHTSYTGWWYFYLVALAVKTPLPLLVAGPIGLWGMARDGWRNRDPWRLAPAALALTILVFASSFSRINIGIRHILILYPFFAIGGAWALTRAWSALAALPRRNLGRAGAAALLALTAWQLSTLWSAFPDYLPYFNEAVRNPQAVLVDSDLDWGQDLRRLEWRAAELKIPYLSLAYRGTAQLAQEPLPPFTNLPPRQPAHGWVAVSALARTRNPEDYAWLDSYEPVERIGKTIDLYYVP